MLMVEDDTLFEKTELKVKSDEEFQALLEEINSAYLPEWLKWHFLSRAYFLGKDDYAKGLENGQKAVQCNPSEYKLWTLYVHIAGCYYGLENWQNAVKYYQKAIEHNPPKSRLWSIYASLCDCYRGLKDWQNALETSQKSFQHNPMEDWQQTLYYWQGEALLQLGRVPEAIEPLQKCGREVRLAINGNKVEHFIF